MHRVGDEHRLEEGGGTGGTHGGTVLSPVDVAAAPASKQHVCAGRSAGCAPRQPPLTPGAPSARPRVRAVWPRVAWSKSSSSSSSASCVGALPAQYRSVLHARPRRHTHASAPVKAAFARAPVHAASRPPPSPPSSRASEADTDFDLGDGCGAFGVGHLDGARGGCHRALPTSSS